MFRKNLIFMMICLSLSFFSGLSQANNLTAQNNGPQEYFETEDDNGQPLILKISPAATATVTPAITCIKFSGFLTGGPTAINTAVVAQGPFTTKCSGFLTGTLTNTSSAFLSLYLQKLVSGVWTNVAGYSSGTSINYSGLPGTYRYVVSNTGGGVGYWQLNYSFPL